MAETAREPASAPVQPSRPAEPPWTRAEVLWLVFVALLALALRVHHVLAMRASPGFEAPIMDALYHLEWARALAAGETFQEGPFFRAPLYPWFLAGLLRIFGEDLLAPRLVQCLLGTAGVVLTHLLARRALGVAVARVAGLVAATYWVLIHFDGELLLPTLIVPLNLLALWATLGLGPRPSARGLLGTGLVWGLSAITRPNVLLFLPFLALWCLGRCGGLRAPFLLAAGVLTAVAPITLYNGLVGGDWALVSTQGGVNFWIGNNPDTDGSTAIVPGTRGGWWEGYHDAIAQAEAAEGRELSPTGVSRHYTRRALDWMGEHPGPALANLLWKLRLFWIDWELGNNQEVRFFAHHFDPAMAWLPVGFALLAGSGLVGLVLLLGDRARRAALFPLWGFLPVYMASVVLFFVCSRFRVPVLPVLIVLGSHAAVQAVGALRAGRWGRGVAIAAAALALALGSHLLRPAGLKTGEANGYWQLGVYAMGRGDLREAEGHLRYATQLDPGNVFARSSLARLLTLRGEYAAAETELRAALALDPGRVDTLEARFELLLARGDQGTLEREARELVARRPHLATPHHWLGRSAAVQGRWEEAAEHLEQALALDPAHLATRLLLVRVLTESGGQDERARARRLLREAQERLAGLTPAQLEQLQAELQRFENGEDR